MFRGINDLSGRLLELYKLRRDGSFFDQQDFMHLLREDEAAAAASVRSNEAIRNNGFEVERDWRQAQTSIYVKTEQDRLDRNFDNLPFSYSAQELHELVREATGGGTRPALLVAPFFHEELNKEGNDDGPHAFRVAIRRAWMNCAWSGDVRILDGFVKRPLRNTDLDVMLLQRALWDLPVILVCGEVQGGARVWPSLTAWNIVDSSDFCSIQVNFPSLPLPTGTSGENSYREARLAFEDELGESTAVTVGMLGEWFHLARYGRRPRIHQTLPENRGLERRAAALGLTAAYEVAMDRGRIPICEGMAEQAALFWTAGRHSEARSVALAALRAGEQTNEEALPLEALRSLQNVLREVGNSEEFNAVTRRVEAAARRAVLRTLGW
ncbi:hypothetical protein [Streptomyces rubiginosohelvolus]|uniref:hypothetical protein n=1 Tax=Streptomyces rubiginosohelvolus TaxID=67362 RepID=UPI0036E4CC1C